MIDILYKMTIEGGGKGVEGWICKCVLQGSVIEIYFSLLREVKLREI